MIPELGWHAEWMCEPVAAG